MNLEVPTIDIGGLPGDRATIDAIADACEAWGFFQIVNHGVDRDARERFLDQMRAFFHAAPRLKRGVQRSAENPMGFYDRELTKNTPDWKEVFDYGMDLRDTDNACRSRWPDGLDDFEAVMREWFDICEHVSFRLLAAISESLGLARDALDRYFDPINTSFVRLNYYPVCDDPQGSLGVNRHTDAGALTVLVQDDVPSLQVNRDGVWHTIQPADDGFIINVGDMLQVWSNDRFKAPEHRVLASGSSERFSAPFFFNPSFATTCVPLNVADGEARYQPVNWGHFRTERANGDYADHGEEIQIAQFRR